MSDQGYPDPAFPGPGGDSGQPPSQPQYGQPPSQPPNQPQYGQPPGQPEFGQAGQPQYGQPPTQPQYGQPPTQPPNQPQYGQPEYGQPQYGQPQYGQPQYGQPQYGTGQYPAAGDTAQYGAVPPQYPPTGGYPVAGPPGGGSGSGPNKGLLAGIGALLVAAIVVAILLLTGVFSSSASAKPEDAVKKLLDAGKTGDISTAKSVLCAADNSLGITNDLAKDRIKSYTIGKVTKKSANEATVTTTVVTTQNSTPDTEAVPVVKEGGKWKVCVSRLGATPSSAPGSVTAPPSAPASDFPSASAPSVSIPAVSNIPSTLNGINPCNYATSLGDAAEIYVAAAETGQLDLAQSCVSGSSVPRSVTESIKAKSTSDYYDPTPTVNGNVAHFKSISGSHTIDVTVEKAATGYAIVGVKVS
jgi:hypothetical protein